MLSSAQKDLLEHHSYLGEYYLSASGFCYRTQVAIRAMVTPSAQMQKYLAGEYDGHKEHAQAAARLQDLRDAMQEQAKVSLRLAKKTCSAPGRVIRQRWDQILQLLEDVKVNVFES